MARKYGPKASEKIGQTMHEFKGGKLKSGGSGKKVTSREQAIAIGISQARRAGYKVPPEPQGHATMKGSLDARVRSYLGKMRPGQEIDARGIARALGGGTDPLEADYALERAEKAGLAVTSDGRWFGPAGTPSRHHATKRSTLDRDDARGYGQYAYRMEQTKAQALSGARAEGFGAHHLDAVEEGWEAERRDTIRGGFAGDSGHATRKKYPGDVGAYWHATRKKYPYIAYWVHTRGRGGRESEPIYVLGTTTRSDEGIVGHDLRVRPLRLGKGTYTMVVAPDDVEDKP